MQTFVLYQFKKRIEKRCSIANYHVFKAIAVKFAAIFIYSQLLTIVNIGELD